MINEYASKNEVCHTMRIRTNAKTVESLVRGLFMARQPVASATPVAQPCADGAFLLDGDSIAVSDWACKAGFSRRFRLSATLPSGAGNVKELRHLSGRSSGMQSIRRISSSAMSSNGRPLGRTFRTTPLRFSFVPLSHEW